MKPGRNVCSLLFCAALTAPLIGLAESSSGETRNAPAAANQPSEEEYIFSEVVTVDWLQIPVNVRDKKGRPTALEPGNFSLLIDGRPIEIESFSNSVEEPVRLLFLQDVSGSMALDHKILNSRAAVRYFLDRALENDQFALASFASGRTFADVPFSSDLETLDEALRSWAPYGQTALHDAVGRIPELQGLLEGGRYGVVLITDGVDNASVLDAQQARATAWNARLPVYVLGFEKATLVPDAPTPDSALHQLAELTGARYFPVSSRAEAVAAAESILSDLRHQSTLSLVLDGNSPERLHQIEVRVAGPRKQTVRYRPSYYGRQPQAFETPRSTQQSRLEEKLF